MTDELINSVIVEKSRCGGAQHSHPDGYKPHFHLEKQTPNGKWTDAAPEHRYYFTEE